MKQIIALLVLLPALAACAAQQPLATPTSSPAPGGGSVDGLDGLLDTLRAAGVDATTGDMVEQPFFSVRGQVVRVNGVDVQVFEYESPEAMEADASQVAPDGGSVGTSMISWVDTPHFYKTGRILALYVGGDESTLTLLKAVLGEQFAGQ